MKLVISTVLIILSFLSCSSQVDSNDTKTNEYQMKFGDFKSRKVSIKANIYVDGQQLKMVSRPARFITDIDSWWDIIKVDKIEDAHGKSIQIKSISGDAAVLNRKVQGKIKVFYTLDFSYIDRDYPNFNTAIGKSFNEGFFIVGKPLFIFGDFNLKTTIRIDKPKESKFTVPWSKKVNNMYTSQNLREMALSNVIISNHAMEVADFSVDGLSYSLATFNMDKKSVNLIKKIAEDISKYYVNAFPVNQEVRYVQLIYGVPGTNGGGEAYPFSSTSAISKNNLEGSFSWRITVFHELFHMWNSHQLNGVSESSNMEWFKEGLTDYMTEKALAKTNHVDPLFLRSFEANNLNALKRVFKNTSKKVSIKSAGSNKGENYLVVYRGGWLISKWLDNQLKKKTNNKWTIEKLFQYLLSEYPQSGENKLTFDVFIQVIDQIDSNISSELKSLLNNTNESEINNAIASFDQL